jgi:hypothetical protein
VNANQNERTGTREGGKAGRFFRVRERGGSANTKIVGSHDSRFPCEIFDFNRGLNTGCEADRVSGQRGRETLGFSIFAGCGLIVVRILVGIVVGAGGVSAEVAEVVEVVIGA